MTWIKIEEGFPEHPKILGLSDAAFRLHIYAICYASRHLTDGLVPMAWLTGGKGRMIPKAATQLVQAGVWDEAEGGYQIHDYLQYQQSRAAVERRRTQKAEHMQRVRAQNVTVHKQESYRPVREHWTQQDKDVDTEKEKEEEKSARTRATPLITSPAEYDRERTYNAFVGSRLRVPNKLHGDLRRDLGGINPEARLQAWYLAVDEEIERTGERIHPDIFKWLTVRFRAWSTDEVGRDELERFRPKGA